MAQITQTVYLFDNPSAYQLAETRFYAYHYLIEVGLTNRLILVSYTY